YFVRCLVDVGIFCAWFAYHVLVEPNSSLGLQSRLWTGGYAALLVLVGACGFALWRLHRNEINSRPLDPRSAASLADPVSPSIENRPATTSARPPLRWVLL